MFNLFGNTTEKFKNVFCDELQEIIENKSDNGNYEIIDCRTPGEYHAGHIPDAKLIDLMDPAFREKVQQLDKDTTYYVYCRSGSRSMTACRVMADAGIEDVHNVKFGLMGWQGPLV
jgi:rhodanese-related sulfurtransferase